MSHKNEWQFYAKTTKFTVWKAVLLGIFCLSTDENTAARVLMCNWTVTKDITSQRRSMVDKTCANGLSHTSDPRSNLSCGAPKLISPSIKTVLFVRWLCTSIRYKSILLLLALDIKFLNYNRWFMYLISSRFGPMDFSLHVSNRLIRSSVNFPRTYIIDITYFSLTTLTLFSTALLSTYIFFLKHITVFFILVVEGAKTLLM